nr:hypothetical protein HUO10_003292 [Paraburkholderia busanensis]
MDIYENRRRWLAYWIEKDFGGDRKAVEMATGYSRSQLSQYLSVSYQGGKSPQERAARMLEQKFGKADRIMETPAPGPGQEALVPTALYKPMDQPVRNMEPPAYVSDALEAVVAAWHADAPREAFDAVRVLFSLLKAPESGSITAPKKDETVKPASSMQSIKGETDKVLQDAESRLATRTEEKRGARKVGEKRSKSVRH